MPFDANDLMAAMVDRHRDEYDDLVRRHVSEIEALRESQRIEVVAARKRNLVGLASREVALSEVRRATLRADVILAAVAAASGESVVVWVTKSQVRRLVEIRKAAVWLLRKHTSLSYPEIGRVFGRDHTTIVYLIRQTENARPDSYVRRLIAQAEDFLPEPEVGSSPPPAADVA